MKANENVTGSGIICYFDNRNGLINNLGKKIFYLVLEDFAGKHDFTKGTLNPGEGIQACAIRETYEESNLDYFDFELIHNPIQINERLVMFLGKIKIDVMIQRDKTIILKYNRQIDSPEHKSYMFLSYEEIIKNEIELYDYLVPYLEAAKNILT